MVLTLGGTAFSPLPRIFYTAAVSDLFINPVDPAFAGYAANFLVTPSKLWPLTGLDSLSLDKSVARGVADLNSAIMTQFTLGQKPSFWATRKAPWSSAKKCAISRPCRPTSGRP
ncbi:hypothetical protein NIIDMKKI_44690 [Mycobacterium kansasii]|uniref:PE-PPE domain-containing protein n=1 Tax=Mycobacterium kansasii TaxID=1768 RepID=A0A7G1IGG6_MYCKA|nr:hypothetical protein NIIDMKKI_44690 [Mycobacterium kansasii]